MAFGHGGVGWCQEVHELVLLLHEVSAGDFHGVFIWSEERKIIWLLESEDAQVNQGDMCYMETFVTFCRETCIFYRLQQAI